MARSRLSLPDCFRGLMQLLIILCLPGWAANAQPPAARADAATSGPWLNVTGSIPKTGQPQSAGQFVVVFDRPITPPLAADGKPAAPWTYSAPQPGDETWEYGPNYFVVHRGSLQFPGGLLKATLNPRLRSADGRELNPAQRVHPLVNQPFEPRNPWVIDSSPGRLVVGIGFTYPVTLDALRQNITLADQAGRPVAFELRPGTSQRTFQLEISKIPVGAVPLKLTFQAGLPETEGLLRLEEPRAFNLAGPPEKTLTVTYSDWAQTNQTTQSIRIDFSARVNPAQAAKFIKVTDLTTTAPRVMATQVWGDAPGNGCFVAFRANDPQVMRIRVEVAPGLAGLKGEALRKPFSKVLEQQIRPSVEEAVSGVDDDGAPFLRMTLSGTVDPDDFTRHLSVTPKIDGMTVTRKNPRTFEIRGDLKLKTVYSLRLQPGLHVDGWITLRRLLVQTVEMPERYPSHMAIPYEGKYYFPRTPKAVLPLRTRNISEVEVRLHRMFPNNVAVANTDLGGEEISADNFIADWCEEVARKRIPIAASSGKMVTTPISLSELMPPGQTGIYMLEVLAGDAMNRKADESGDDYGRSRRRYRYRYYYGEESSSTRVTRTILMTSMGALAHWTKGELSLFAHDLYSLKPVEGARVRVFTSKNQLCGEGFTDAQGMVSLKSFLPALGKPIIALIEKGADYSYLYLADKDSRYEPYSSENDLPFTPEMQLYDKERYDAYIYADRALYRPGETVHLRAIGRRNYGDALTSVPLTLKVLKPNGDALLEQPVTLSEWGTASLDVATQKTHPTGAYTVQLTVPGEETPLATYGFQLEEFVPNRLQATVEIPEPRWVGTGTTHSLVVVGKHLFGAPAENRTAEARVYLARGWQPQAWRGYRFDNDSTFELDSIPLGEQTTGKDGRAPYVFSWAAPPEVTTPLRVNALGMVYEVGGRKVYGRASTMLFPSDICLGVAGEPGKQDGEIVIRAAAVRPDESPAALDKVEVTLERQVWNYTVRDYSTYQEPHWTGDYQAVETRQVSLKDGVGLTSFTTSDYGYYRVRVHSPATRLYSSLLFYSFGGPCSVTETLQPKLVRLTLGKPVYRVGELAELRVETPFDGKAVIVIQGETIRRMMTIDVRKGVGSTRFIVQPEDYANTWIETTVIHAIDRKRTQVYPFASFAMTNLRVEDPERRLVVAVNGLPKEVKPAQPLTLQLETRDAAGTPTPAEVTLAAVDEGIHSIKGYTNPDPYAHFSRPYRPDLHRSFYYDKVAYDFGTEASPGGDGDLAASLGRPKTNWIKTVALWTGPVVTGADGKATVTLNIPEFTGELRVVAVAAGKRAVGAFAGSLLVRRPWILETSMPRFLLPGDRAQCRATLYNLTSQACRASISWTHQGVLGGGDGRRELTIAANSEASITADFAAGGAVGQGLILWRAEIVDPATSRTLERLAEDAPIPVAEPAAYQRREDLTILKPGQSATVTNTAYLEDELTRLGVTVGAQPQLKLQKALIGVIGYPYGCVEQTTSKLMPLYLLRKSEPLVQSALKQGEKVDDYLRAGVDRLFSMQTDEGGLAFWPGGAQPYPYGSVYALHALTLIANGREIPLPEESLGSLRRYVRKLAGDWGDNSYSALYTRAYALYVLSLGGDQEALKEIDRFDAIDLPRPARYLLAAALARNTKDTDRVKLYLTSAPATPWSTRELAGTLSSDVRNSAVELMALSQARAGAGRLEPLAAKLTRYLEATHYGTTQELAFVTAALCDYMDTKTTDVAHASAVIVEGGKEHRISGRETYASTHRGPGGKFEVRNTGVTDICLNVTMRGVPAKAQAEVVKQGMAVRRRFFTRDGAPLTTSTALRQGESYVVEVELFTEQDAKNVVVADLLPAGLEVENPRLSQDNLQRGKLPFASEAPTHLEVRDERVVLFYDRLDACATDQPDRNHHFYYVVNAVTPGEFTYPAISAECMYDPAVRGASRAHPLKVEGR